MVEQNPVVSHPEWVEARTSLLVREKQLTRLREELALERRGLPWEAVTKEYAFEGTDGKRTLAEMFEDRSQLIVYHFMFDPDWDEGCPYCSFWADNFNGAPVHLQARDVTLTAVSRAPFAKIAAYKQRMGWTFPWVSSFGTDFNYDFGVSFSPGSIADHTAVYNYGSADPGSCEEQGISVFFRNQAGEVFHTYSTYARGIDMVNGTYHFLDLVPRGRDEPAAGGLSWVRRHDEYGS